MAANARFASVLLCGMLLGLLAPAWGQLLRPPADDLLDPEKAFRVSARAIDGRNVEIQFEIADGYYMYRDRFSFATESGERLAEVDIPRGKPKVDEFFGATETFRDLVRIRVPISAGEAAKGSVKLKVTSQGCADIGVCYTPLHQTVTVSLAGAAAPRLPSSSRDTWKASTP